MFTPYAKINHQITSPELRVLSESGENLGLLSKDAALKIAVERGLDLIEISPNAKPPVARIMSFDKFRYEEEKKRKKQRIEQKGFEPKQVQISVRAAKNDLTIKAKKADEFLTEGHPVTVALTLRGREKANKDWAKQKLNEFLAMITVPHQVAGGIRWGGRGMNIQIMKK